MNDGVLRLPEWRRGLLTHHDQAERDADRKDEKHISQRERLLHSKTCIAEAGFSHAGCDMEQTVQKTAFADEEERLMEPAAQWGAHGSIFRGESPRNGKLFSSVLGNRAGDTT